MEESMHVGEQETSLQDQSYHTIRRKIVYLDYKPGEKLGVKLSGFDQRGNPRSGDFEVQRRVFKCSARRFPSVLVVDFD